MDSQGLIQGPGRDEPVNAPAAIAHIEALYRTHLFDYFTHHGKTLPDWCHKLEFEIKMIGHNIALHGAANYAIGPLPGSGDSPLIKARGHPLHAEHYNPETGAPMVAPMKGMMVNRLMPAKPA